MRARLQASDIFGVRLKQGCAFDNTLLEPWIFLMENIVRRPMAMTVSFIEEEEAHASTAYEAVKQRIWNGAADELVSSVQCSTVSDEAL